MRMGRKKKAKQQEEQYHVEVITKAKVNDDDEWEYFVKWAGYSSDDNSWEPSDNVASCERLLRSFWNHIGVDDDDVPRGTVLKAKDSWIEREKRYFAEHFAEETGTKHTGQDRSSTKGIPQGRVKVKEAPKVAPTSSASNTSRRSQQRKRPLQASDSDDSDDDVSLLSISRKKKKPKKAVITVDSSSESEDPTWAPPSETISTEDRKENMPQHPAKGKGKQRASSPPSPAPESDSDSLFSGPSRSPSPDATLDQPPPSGSHNPPTPVSTAIDTSGSCPAQTPTSPKPTINLHTHRAAPKIKLMAPQLTEMNRIPTKQRIAQGVSSSSSAPSVPSLPSGLTIPKKSTALSRLSFKKRTSSATSPASPSLPSTSITTAQGGGSDRQELVQSPVDAWGGGWGSPPPKSLDPVPSYDSRMPPPKTQPTRDPRRNPIPLPRSKRPPNPPASDVVDDFLASAMPPELAAQMHETAGDESPIAPSAPSSSTPKVIKPLPGRISRKWRWEGELYIEVSGEKADRICEIALDELTDPRPEGLRLSVCTSTIDSLRFKKLYDLPDIHLVLPACGVAQQFCRVLPKADRDSSALSTLRMYLQKRQLFTYADISLDNDPVGLLFIFPSALVSLCDLFGVPQRLRADNGLVGTLVSWALSTDSLKSAMWRKRREHMTDEKTHHRLLLPESMQNYRQPLKFHYAMRVLKFPPDLLKWIASSNRQYCICYAHGDGTRPKSNNKEDEPGAETMLLKAILGECPLAVDTNYNHALRVIFVHVGCVQSLNKVSSMSQRRAKQPQVRIFTYGSHARIPPNRWGVREVYPLGGVVTFTPDAIIENPIGAHKLMDRLNKHPLWTGFLNPTVVGAVAKVICREEDPLSLISQGTFPHSSLLDLIEEGHISLVTSPPSTRRPVRDRETRLMRDPIVSWIATQFGQVASGPQNVMEGCLRALEGLMSEGKEQGDIAKAAASDAFSNLGSMQFQPALMDSYRRFVLVTGKKDNLKDKLLEIVTVNEFDFRDSVFGDPL